MNSQSPRLLKNKPFELMDAIAEVRKYGLHRDPLVANYVFHLQANPEDIELQGLVTEAIQGARERDIKQPNPFRATSPTQQSDLPGDLVVGRIVDAKILWRVPADLFREGFLCVGRPGGGKSTLLRILSAQFHALGVILKIYDRKGDFTMFATFPGFTYLTQTYQSDNALMPALGDTYRKWIPQYFEIIGTILWLLVPSRNRLTKAALQLCEENDVENGGPFPTLHDILKRMKVEKYPVYSKLARYGESGEDRIEGSLLVLGDQIASSHPMDYSKYLNTSTALHLDGIPTDYQASRIGGDVGKVIRAHQCAQMPAARLKTAIVIDEASTVFGKKLAERESNYMLLDNLAQAREFGVAFLIASQSPASLAPQVLACTGIKTLIGGLGLGQDYDLFSSSVGLTKDQQAFIRGLTQPGVACVKDPRWPYPFLVEVGNVNP